MQLFRKKDSRFYWYDFKVGGKRYRGSTKETNKKRAGRIGALRFSQAIEGTGLLDRKAPSLQELATRFLGGSNQQLSGPDKKILRQWLAAVVQQNHRRHAS